MGYDWIRAALPARWRPGCRCWRQSWALHVCVPCGLRSHGARDRVRAARGAVRSHAVQPRPQRPPASGRATRVRGRGGGRRADFADDLDVTSHLVYTSGPSVSRHSTLVRVEAIDDVLPRKPVALVKLDVEGAEMLALRGMRALLGAGLVQALLVEAHDHSLRKMGSSRQEVIDLLTSSGYETCSYDAGAGALRPLASQRGDFLAIRARDRGLVEARLAAGESS